MTVALLTSQQPAEALALGARWATTGEAVTVVLLDGATTVLRPGHGLARCLEQARSAGVVIWAHHDAVTERLLTDVAGAAELVDLDRIAALVGDVADTVQWW
jgi:hypothetical protein